ncbi:hypothetical protein PMES_03233 [Profundibacterium mesophilum KAUST100406-0324]|uniref:Uncharacterized protein n=1 Tax=Profundibacterium mesophilum KAUST100406-0324 TaxID=1037889 RepID=A0A921NSV9_9RHOB|nr:hypothetical protein PMES_03233 [Profundibacterium mesophilum KAUST100406-0324]
MGDDDLAGKVARAHGLFLDRMRACECGSGTPIPEETLRHRWRVYCSNCGRQTTARKWMADAVEAWNRGAVRV